MQRWADVCRVRSGDPPITLSALSLSSSNNNNRPGSVREIGTWAFFNCTSLKKLTILRSSSNVAGLMVGEQVFYDCPELSKVSTPDEVVEGLVEPYQDCMYVPAPCSLLPALHALCGLSFFLKKRRFLASAWRRNNAAICSNCVFAQSADLCTHSRCFVVVAPLFFFASISFLTQTYFIP